MAMQGLKNNERFEKAMDVKLKTIPKNTDKYIEVSLGGCTCIGL